MSFLTDLIQSLFGPKPKPVRPTPVPTPVVPPKPTPVPVLPTPVPTPDDVPARLLEAHNAIRASRGRPPLALNAMLVVAATKHAGLMAARGMMAHQLPGEPSFDRRITATGYRWSRAAENVAAGQASVPAAMAAWQKSPGHMANIVGPCSEMGGGMAVGANGVPYWSVSFASPAGQFGAEADAAPMLVTTVLGVGGQTSSIQIGPQGEDTP